MTEPTYRVVITDKAGVTSASRRGMPKELALGVFSVIARGAMYAPDGGGRVRVVTERECAAILAIAGRADR